MITGALIDLFGRIIYFLIDSLPSDILVPEAFSTAVSTIYSQAYAWNWLLPVDTLVLILSLTMAFYTGIIAVTGLKWVINIIRGSGA